MKTFAQILAEGDEDFEVIVIWSDIKEKKTKKKFKTRKAFDKWSTKNEGKGKVDEFIKYPD